jgi:predicted translin family RNA/ssDNA-binding protein
LNGIKIQASLAIALAIRLARSLVRSSLEATAPLHAQEMLNKRLKQKQIAEQVKKETVYVDEETELRKSQYCRRALRVLFVGSTLVFYAIFFVWLVIVWAK